VVLVGRPSDHRKGRWATGALALALLGVCLTGCSEPPSFELGWKLADAATIMSEDSAAALSTVEQCSQVGVAKIRVTTMLGDACTGSVVDTREYPCFPEALPVEGPTLEPGEYTLLVQGLRRTGEAWACEQDSCVPDPAAPACVARATTELTVVEGSVPSLAVVLLSPPECDDGVDNDHDGRVDGRDPACILDVAGAEDADASVTIVQAAVTFLDSPAIKPFNVGVDALLLEVDGELLAVIADNELDLTQWPYRLPILARGLEPGAYEFSITAVDGALVPRTEPITLPFEVPEDQGGYIVGQFDFSEDLFLEPIVEPIAFSTSLLLSPQALSGPSCALGGFVDNQQIMLERVWVRVTDANDQALDAATLGLTGSAAIGGPIMPVDEAGGWVSFECASSAVSSTALTWGGYDIEVEGRIGAVACFETPMISELAPQPISAQNLYLERVLVDGVPPDACRECSEDSAASDCSGQICVDGVCVN
jgi:hypothetical protein